MRELDKAAIGHHLPDEASQNLVRLEDGGGGGRGGENEIVGQREGTRCETIEFLRQTFNWE